ncbi:Bro-N domain-containing protein [Pseudodesulfovibrio indicus]|uniref:BRO-N domain-containing protein n=1 Tax=Pseudodesulfovibrio indicus TaxID=1716143 RepID=UPI003AAE80B3
MVCPSSSTPAQFTHELFGTVRVLKTDDGEIWFIAKDVCDALTIDTSNLSKLLDDDERSTCPVQYTDQVRAVSIINESGLYSLILRSRRTPGSFSVCSILLKASMYLSFQSRALSPVKPMTSREKPSRSMRNMGCSLFCELM